LLGVLALIAFKRGDRRLQRAFMLIDAAAMVWCFALAATLCARTAEAGIAVSRVAMFAVVFTGPGALRFADAMLRRKADALEYGSLAVTLLLATLGPTTDLLFDGVWAPPWGGLYPKAGPLFPIIVLALGVQYMIGGYRVLRAERGMPPSLRRRQLRYVLASIGIGAIGTVDVLGGYLVPIFPIGWACGFASVLVVLYATAAHRLMDMRQVATRTVVWTAVSLLVLPASYFAWRLEGRLGLDAPLPTAVLLAMLLVCARLYVTHARPWLDRVIDARHLALGDLVVAFAERALACRTPLALRELLVHTLRDGTRAEDAVLLSRTPEGVWTVYPAAAGPPPRDGDPGLASLVRAGEPTTLDRLDSIGDQASALPARVLLARFSGSAAVPLHRRGELVGLLLVAARRGGRTFADHELAFMSDLTREAAVALVNARLFGELELEARGLSEQVTMRTAEIARTLEDLKHAQARLVHAERMSSLGLLVAGVSHEINNALNFIYGNLPALRKYVAVMEQVLALREARAGATLPATDEETAALTAARVAVPEIVDVLEERARRVRRTVEDLRRFARHDESERKRAAVHDGLESTLNLIGPAVGDRIAVTRAWGTVPEIECSPGALNQVWMALLLNAAQAIPGSGRIEVRTAEIDGAVVVDVIDSGEGMTPAARARAFEPFFTSRPSEAAGLGLTVARGIVERHGGAIELESEPGRGTRVRVSLPVSPSGVSAA
jgi:signal transduction histidine kinase